MFEVLVAFGAPGTVSEKKLLATLAALEEYALVVGYIASKGKAPGTRWFTLMGRLEQPKKPESKPKPKRAAKRR